MAPVYEGEGETGDEDPSVFKNGYPDCECEGKDIVSCFDEPNILYRIIDPQEKTWAFYNDSTNYEVHVEFSFGKNSKLEALENTTIEQDDDGKFVTRTVVYPTETEMFVQGKVSGYTSKLRALPLSEDYHNFMRAITEKKIQEEQNAVNQITSSQNAEEVLASCVENNVMFIDPEFPPEQASIETGAKKPMKQLAWARPQMFLPEEMADQIRLFRIPPIPGKVDAGDLGDSWVMCSVAAVTEDKGRLVGMFRHPDGKEAAQREHAVGAYRVTFCKNGWWRTVLVDSYLPVSGGRPKYAKSMNDPAEIWPSILEKAYAKLHGSYARIITGDPLHALHDMTGFSTLRFDGLLAESGSKKRSEDELFQDLIRGIRAGYTVIVNTPGKDPKASDEKEDDLSQQYKSVGLLTGHAYTILDAKDFPDHDISVVKIRNAWGHGIEWNGDWGDNDERWSQYPDIAEECNFQKADDGTFWMTWEEVQKYFTGGGICFSHTPAYDYRINSAFNDAIPSCVLEVEVNSPTWITFVISQEDRLSREQGYEYQPVMLSIAEPEGSDFKVVMNSTVSGVRPSPDKWTFLKGRDISLIQKFEAGKYLVVPRILASDNMPEQVPYVLGVIANREIGAGEVDIKLQFFGCFLRSVHEPPEVQRRTYVCGRCSVPEAPARCRLPGHASRQPLRVSYNTEVLRCFC
ncbi:calpain-like cysteine peptidase [Angomonas deanei]|nr:calpain-like cysteine peptidase [Angomonas deanei]|eukprot:EPY42995.1 calpain-like cysteine peptidase [Angomonas deanei]